VPLDFVGVDPNSPQNKCPAVYRDPVTLDFYFQGKLVTDPLKLAEIAKHTPIGADEAVVCLPARMAEIIADAAAGTYERGLQGYGAVSFEDLLAGARHSAVHLEMRDTYDATDPAFTEWLAGGSGIDDSWAAWTELIGSAVARGVKVRRARIVSEPVTDYIRWEHMLTDLNVKAGEQVRWLPRRQAYDLMLPGADFWMFDGRLVVFNFNAGDGPDTQEEEFTNDPGVLTRCIAAFEQLWERAIPHEKYQPN
jgi:hypothetical protein